MRVVQIVMTDKEFEKLWKKLNHSIEIAEERPIKLAKMQKGMFGIHWTYIFKGLFGCPNSYVKYTTDVSEMVYGEQASVAEELTFRFIQAVLKG